MVEHRIEWLSRQMYSRARPIGRDQILEGLSHVLAALTGAPVDVPDLVAQEELPDCAHLGYWAAKLTYRLGGAAQASLIVHIDPIPGSMGVSGEHLSWRGEHLPVGVTISGSALSHALQPGHALLRLDGLAHEVARELIAKFSGAFPKRMSAQQLERELG